MASKNSTSDRAQFKKVFDESHALEVELKNHKIYWVYEPKMIYRPGDLINPTFTNSFKGSLVVEVLGKDKFGTKEEKEFDWDDVVRVASGITKDDKDNTEGWITILLWIVGIGFVAYYFLSGAHLAAE